MFLLDGGSFLFYYSFVLIVFRVYLLILFFFKFSELFYKLFFFWIFEKFRNSYVVVYIVSFSFKWFGSFCFCCFGNFEIIV